MAIKIAVAQIVPPLALSQGIPQQKVFAAPVADENMPKFLKPKAEYIDHLSPGPVLKAPPVNQPPKAIGTPVQSVAATPPKVPSKFIHKCEMTGLMKQGRKHCCRAGVTG